MCGGVTPRMRIFCERGSSMLSPRPECASSLLPSGRFPVCVRGDVIDRGVAIVRRGATHRRVLLATDAAGDGAGVSGSVGQQRVRGLLAPEASRRSIASRWWRSTSPRPWRAAPCRATSKAWSPLCAAERAPGGGTFSASCADAASLVFGASASFGASTGFGASASASAGAALAALEATASAERPKPVR